MLRKTFRRGDFVVYRKMKHKTHPGRRARGVRPQANGDDYSYYVEKFWVVIDVLADGRLVLQTPRARRHVVVASDPNLRHARWLEKIRHFHRLRDVEGVPTTDRAQNEGTAGIG